MFIVFSQSDDDILQGLDDLDTPRDDKKEIELPKGSIKGKDLDIIYGGQISSFYTIGDITTRHSTKLRLFLEKKFNDYINFKLSLRVVNAQITQTIKLKKYEPNSDGGRDYSKDPTEEELSDTISIFELEPRDLYANFSGSYWDLSIGYQTYALGQASLASPIDFLLIPNRSDSFGLSLNKLDEKLSQPLINFSLNKSGWKFNYFYHPIVVVDEFKKRQFEQTVRQNIPILNDNGSFNRFESMEKKAEIPRDSERHLLQLLYYGSNFTLGFTYYKGLNLQFFNKPSKLEPRERIAGSKNKYESIDLLPNFDDIKLYALEASMTKGKWRYFSEFGFVDGFSIRLPQVSEESSSEYYDLIYDENDGRLRLNDIRFGFFALGFDYTGKRHQVNFYILSALPELKSFGKRLQDVYEKTIAESPHPQSNELENDLQSFVFPTVNWTYFLEEEKKTSIGLAAGNFTTARGIGVYYTNRKRENFSWSIIASAIEFSNDVDVFEKEDSLEEIELKEGFSPNLTAAFSYSF